MSKPDTENNANFENYASHCLSTWHCSVKKTKFWPYTTSYIVCSSNLGAIWHRFGDLTAFMCSWPHIYSTLIWGRSVAPDRPRWASTSAWALSYSAVKLFSKNSDVRDHGT